MFSKLMWAYESAEYKERHLEHLYTRFKCINHTDLLPVFENIQQWETEDGQINNDRHYRNE